jgi:hypothetical protein
MRPPRDGESGDPDAPIGRAFEHHLAALDLGQSKAQSLRFRG